MNRIPQPLLVALLCFSLLSNAGCFKSKNVVNRIPPADGSGVTLNGVAYALPRTVIKATVPFTRIDKAPGEFEPYTPCFFSPAVAAGRIKAETNTFKINPPNFGSCGEPDPNEHYIAKIKGGYFENKTMLLEFNDDGVITKGDVSSENVAIDVAIKAARTVISAAASLAAVPGAADSIKAAKRAQLDRPQIDICRSVVMVEAAAIAAESAKEAAKASGVGAAINAADQASAYVKSAEQLIASAKNDFTKTVWAVETDNAGPKTLVALTSRTANLVNEVACYVKQAKQESLAASGAAATVAFAADEAAETTKAAARIDYAAKLVAVSDSETP